MKHLFLTISVAFFCIFTLTPNDLYSQDKKDKKEKTEKTNDVEIIHLTKEIFLKKVWNYEKNPKEWIYEGDKPCIIDFYADWCGPCRQFAPTLQTIANKYKGKLYCYKINIDEQKELASVFGVKSIPSILFIPQQGQAQMGMGNMPKETVVKAIEEVLLIDSK